MASFLPNIFECIFLGSLKSKRTHSTTTKPVQDGYSYHPCYFGWVLFFLLATTFFSLNNAYGQNCQTLTPSFTYQLSNQQGCVAIDTINLKNTSKGIASLTGTYYWYINNVLFDSTSSLQSPISLIRTAGDYTIRLVSKSWNSCFDTTEQKISISGSLAVDFSLFEDSICLNSTAILENTTKDTNLNSTYTWSFGDGSYSNNKDTVSHIYNTSGDYNISLTIVTSTNCTGTATKKIHVKNAGGSIQFYDNYGNVQQNTNWKRCINLVTEPDSLTQDFATPDTLFNYRIDFGDGTTSSGTTLLPYPNGLLTHTFKSTGVFDIIVTAESSSACKQVFKGKVINLRVPTVGIGGPYNGNQNGCIPFQAGFKNTSTHVSNDTKFTWDFADGTTATFDNSNQGDSVYHVYNKAACNMVITLTSANVCGSTQATWGPVNAYDRDSAIISPDSQAICYPNTSIVLKNKSLYNCYSGNRSFYWDFGDGSNSGWINLGVSQSHQYSNSGIYNITYYDSNLCGVSIASSKVFVYGPLEADFEFSPGYIGCRDFVVNFTNLSVGDSINYLWDFGDGKTSTLKNPVHTFTDTGTFNVKLTVNGICGIVSKTETINVYKNPVASFSNIDNQCKPAKISINNKTKDISPYSHYEWYLDNSLISQKNNPENLGIDQAGTYQLLLIVKDTCGLDSFSQPFTIYENPIAKYTYSVACLGDSTKFVNLSSLDSNSGTISTYYWTFGDGYADLSKQPGHIYDSSKSYSSSLVVTSDVGCKDTFSQNIEVKQTPVSSFTIDPAIIACEHDTLLFKGNTGQSIDIDSIIWDFGDSTSSFLSEVHHSYTHYGNFNVTLRVVAKNACSAESSKAVKIYGSPTADFVFDSVCEGSSTQFQDVSISNGNEVIQSIDWDFNNDQKTDANTASPQYKFNTPGDYQVSLAVITKLGCSDTAIKTVKVYQNPSALFSTVDSSFCQNEAITFTNNSTLSDSFIWNFNDGNAFIHRTDTSRVIYQYDTHGVFIVSLTALNSNACKSDTSLRIKINPKPIASFESPIYSNCAPFMASFRNTSKYADDYQWLCDNKLKSNADTLANQTFTTKDDSFEIMLIASNQYHCGYDSFRKQYNTYDNPKTYFTADRNKGCGPMEVNFSNSSLSSLYYSWDFGDGHTSNDKNPSHTFYASNTQDTFYVVTLSSYSSINCIDSFTDTVHVFPKPQSSFIVSRDQGCGPLAVNFINTSTPKDTGNIDMMSFMWDFNMGLNSTQKNPNIIFPLSQIQDTVYEVILIAYSEHNCIDTAVKNIRVFPKPHAAFTLNNPSGCAPLNVKINNKSYPKDTGSIRDMTFSWDFGNQYTSGATNPEATFLASIYQDTSYNIELIAYSEHHCADTITRSVTIFPNPVSLFETDRKEGCEPLQAHFSNKSYPNDTGSIKDMTFIWKFGNGLSSTNINDTSVYAASNLGDTTYTVSLIAISEHNCIDTSQKQITIHPNPYVHFSLNDTRGCGPFFVKINNSSFEKGSNSSSNMDFEWDLGNGQYTNASDTSLLYQPSQFQDSVYTISLKGTSQFGCVDSFSKNILVYPVPDVSFTSSKNHGCGPLTLQFQNTSDPKGNASVNKMTFNWDFGNGQTSNSKNDLVTFYASKTKDTLYNIVLTGYSEYGCMDKDSQIIQVYPDPVASFQTSFTKGCSPLAIEFKNHSVPNDTGNINIMSFLWVFGNGDSSFNKSPTTIFNNTSNYKESFLVTLHAYSEHGCMDQDTLSIVAIPSPEVNFYQSDTIACNALTVDFINTSVPHDLLGINQMDFNWVYGNNISSKAKDASVHYSGNSQKDAVYKIKLTGTNQYGCMDSVESEVVVHPNPLAAFIYDDPKHCGNNVRFINQSISNDTSGHLTMQYQWNFNNSKLSNAYEDSISFKASNYQDTNYMVSLIAVNDYQCSDTAINTILVHPAPKIAFNVSKLESCSGLNIYFENTSTLTDSIIWNFGDGTTYSGEKVLHTYTHSGSKAKLYKASLTGRSAFGCWGDSAVKDIIIHPSLSANFITSTDSGCGSLNVNMINNSVNASNFSWHLDSLLLSNQVDLTHVFKSSLYQDTIYQIKLVASNNIGCSDTLVKDIKVFQTALADFQASKTSGCYPLHVNFSSKSLGAKKLLWDFQNGDTSTQNNPSVVFDNISFETKYFDVKLFAISHHNCIDTAQQRISVFHKPLSVFMMDKVQGCDKTEIQLTNKAIGAKKLYWDFGDGMSSTNENPDHTYYSKASDTFYMIRQIAESELGCRDSFERDLKVYAITEARFNISTKGCAPVSVHLKDSSINANDWLWDFGDGSSSTLQHPVHTYKDAGKYAIMLRVSNTRGCADTLILKDSIIVYEVPESRFKIDKLSSDYPDKTFNFQSKSDSSLDHLWLSNGILFNNSNNEFEYSFPDTGSYTISLIVSNASCSDSSSRTINIYPPIPKAGFKIDQSVGCEPMAVSFSDTSTALTTHWLWHFGDGATSEEQHPVHQYKYPGSYSVTLIIENSRGADATYKQHLITVHPKPNLNFEASPETAYMPDAKINLINLSVNNAINEWYIDNTLMDTNKAPTWTLNQPGSYDITLIATSKHGCKDTLSKYNVFRVDTQSTIFIPNAFTPNGDGLNDQFKPLGFGYHKEKYKIVILNRWGEIMFESDTFEKGWDGTKDGEFCTTGVYIYQIRVKLSSGKTEYYDGRLTLLR